MKPQVSIYLAGSIQKGHEKNNSLWGDEERDLLEKALSHYQVLFLNPALRIDDLSDQKAVFGRDMLQVFCSDVVFVDARDRRGLGVGAEMMWAKFHSIPVVTLAPKETHYHKSQTTLLGSEVKDWVHPFVESLSDAVVESIADGANWIHRVMTGELKEIKNAAFMESAMQRYKTLRFEGDEPMQDLASCSAQLMRRIQNLKRESSLIS